MKKLLLHIILISYTALLFKPVMPFVNDFVGHVFFYARHLATVHEENGRFHVHLEAAKTSREENNKEGNTPASSKKDNSVTEHCFFIINDEPVFGNSVHLHYQLRNNDAVCNGNIQKKLPTAPLLTCFCDRSKRYTSLIYLQHVSFYGNNKN